MLKWKARRDIMEPEVDSAWQLAHHALGEETEKRRLCVELRYRRWQ